MIRLTMVRGMPVSRAICRVERCDCGLSSWLSSTSCILSSVRNVTGLPLPGCRSMLPVLRVSDGCSGAERSVIPSAPLTCSAIWRLIDITNTAISNPHPGVGRYVGFTPMWERTICGFRAGRRGYAASLLCRHINVIKNSYFLSSRVNLEYGPLRSLEAL